MTSSKSKWSACHTETHQPLQTGQEPGKPGTKRYSPGGPAPRGGIIKAKTNKMKGRQSDKGRRRRKVGKACSEALMWEGGGFASPGSLSRNPQVLGSYLECKVNLSSDFCLGAGSVVGAELSRRSVQWWCLVDLKRRPWHDIRSK